MCRRLHAANDLITVMRGVLEAARFSIALLLLQHLQERRGISGAMYCEVLAHGRQTSDCSGNFTSPTASSGRWTSSQSFFGHWRKDINRDLESPRLN
jgi:hypothetical protein